METEYQSIAAENSPNSETAAPDVMDVGKEKKSLLSRFSPKQQDFLRGKHAASNAATVLVLIIYALLLLSRLIDSAFLSRES